MSEAVAYLLLLATADNLVLERGIGAYTLEAGSQRESLALALAVTTGAFLLTGALLAILLQAAFGTESLALLLLPLTALLAASAEICLRRLPAPWDERIRSLLPLSICNALLLGVVLVETVQPWQLPVRALGAALGLALLLLICTHLRARLRATPAPFRGTPAFLVALGLISMALQAFG